MKNSMRKHILTISISCDQRFVTCVCRFRISYRYSKQCSLKMLAICHGKMVRVKYN